MKMFRLLCFCLFGLLTGSLMAQSKPTAEKAGQTLLSADAFVGYDNFHALYSIKNNVLRKEFEGKSWEYKAVALGRISRADIRNPLQIVLFYEDYNTVVLLDNQLNETQRVDFSQLASPLVASAVGLSGQNKLWVFNTLSQRVGLYDLVTKELREITVPVSGKVLCYQSDFNYFYWIAQDGFLRRTDIFGKLQQLAQLPGTLQFTLAEDGIGYALDETGKALRLNLRDGSRQWVEIDEKTLVSLQWHAQILSIFTGSQISNYKIRIP